MNAPTTVRSPALVPRQQAAPSRLRRFVGVVARSETYRRLAYLLVALPLGTIWFAVLVTLIAVGLSLLVVVLLGIPVLVATWFVVRAMADVERSTTRTLLQMAVSPAPVTARAHANLWKRLRSMSTERARWRELTYLLLRFPVGVVTFTATVTALAAPFIVAAVPISARIGDRHPSYGNWTHSDALHDLAVSSWSWLLVPLAALLLLVAVHLLVALADACGRWSVAWLAGGVSAKGDQSANLEPSNVRGTDGGSERCASWSTSS